MLLTAHLYSGNHAKPSIDINGLYLLLHIQWCNGLVTLARSDISENDISTKQASDLQGATGGFHYLTQLGSEVAGAIFTSVVHELHFACSWISLILDPAVCLDGARPANTCIPPSFPWMAPTHCGVYPPLKGTFPPQRRYSFAMHVRWSMLHWAFQNCN